MISTGPSVMHLARFVNGYPFKPDQLGEDGFPVIRIRQLLDDCAEPERAQPPPDAVFINSGDLILSWSATLAVRLWERGPGLLNQHLYRVDTGPVVDKRWFRYVLEVGVARLTPLMHGSAMTHITQDMLRVLTIAVPCLPTQHAIADYLDAETARIDALIEKKQRMVELLEERCWSVTSSLAEATPERAPLRRYIIDACDGPFGSALKSEHYVEGGARVIRLGNIGRANWKDDDTAYISVPYWRTLARHQARKGDLVIAGLGDDGNPVGRAAVVPAIEPAMVKADCYRLRIDACLADVRFLAWYLSSPEGLAQSEQRSEGSTRPRLTLSKALALRVPWLPLNEQQLLADRVENEVARLGHTKASLQCQVRLLQEHRQALITGAVTGQPEIPGIAA